MKKKDKQILAQKIGELSHQEWCKNEIVSFYNRYKKQFHLYKNFSKALESACFVKGVRRNEIDIKLSAPFLNIKNKSQFLHFVAKKMLVVKRFVNRRLSLKEKRNAGKNYNNKTHQENILRAFDSLSNHSKSEYINGAMSAINVYEYLLKQGVSIQNMSSKKYENYIGKLIHYNWLARNKRNKNNSYLFVPFENLSKEDKRKDLNIFKILIDNL